MKISECKYGEVVCTNYDGEPGHIKGFCHGHEGQILVKIQWPCGSVSQEFPESLDLYGDQHEN